MNIERSDLMHLITRTAIWEIVTPSSLMKDQKGATTDGRQKQRRSYVVSEMVWEVADVWRVFEHGYLSLSSAWCYGFPVRWLERAGTLARGEWPLFLLWSLHSRILLVDDVLGGYTWFWALLQHAYSVPILFRFDRRYRGRFWVICYLIPSSQAHMMLLESGRLARFIVAYGKGEHNELRMGDWLRHRWKLQSYL